MSSRFCRSVFQAVLVLCAAFLTCIPASAAKPRPLLGCQAKPETVHPSEPVTVTGTGLYLDPNRPVSYTWQTTGGRLGTAGDHANINTSGLAPGEYTVTGRLIQGEKPAQQAECTARFKVVSFEPPTVSCKATPTSGATGSTFDISASAFSGQNRPLTYAFSTSAGHLATSGVTAKLSTKDVMPGIVKVTCYVVDDHGLSGSATTQINLSSQLAPAGTATRHLCSLNFAHDRQHPMQVDTPSEACLDSVAAAMRQDPASRLVIVGNASPEEAPENAAERSMNARLYLASVRGISQSRIEVRVGETSGPTANTVLLPAGTSFTEPNASTFDESLIILHGAPYAPPKTSASRPGARRSGATRSSAAPY